ncbi:MAG: HU family DNA-binding protein [Pseudomonadota bacterium]
MAKPSPTKPPQPVEMGPVMRKKELLDTVVKKTGMRKNEVKPILETLLVVLGDALRENRELILPPLGKVKVQREKKVNGGRMAIARLRQNDPLSPIDLSLVGPSSTKGSD